MNNTVVASPKDIEPPMHKKECSGRLKVLLICHFSNPEIRSLLKLDSCKEYHDFAVWITNRLSAYATLGNLDVHVVSPHKGMQHKFQQFESNGIYYYFFNAGSNVQRYLEIGMNILFRKTNKLPIIKILYKLKSLYWMIAFLKQKRLVQFLSQSIRPDVIHLNGAENPYYSSTVLGLEKFNIPILVSIQGIIGDPDLVKSSEFIDVPRIEIEQKIHSTFRYYIVGSAEHYKLVKMVNPSALFMFSPDIRTINIDPKSEEIHKEFDFVFMSRVTRIKGIEHALMAIRNLRESSYETSLLVLGPISQSYLLHLSSLCESFGIKDRVVFAGHVPKRDDLYRQALRASIFILPTDRKSVV